MFRWFSERAARKEAAEKIYDAIVAQSRNPAFYLRFGVPDTLSGRFDMLVIHMFMVLQNLRLGGKEGELLGREVVEAFIREMDSMVRDLGVSDNQVPKEVRRIAGLFYGQILIYAAAAEKQDPAALGEAVWKSFRSGNPGTQVNAQGVAEYILEALEAVRQTPLTHLLQGYLDFPEVTRIRRAG
jgi:cytochrome b pre-mRNA-processing protein 3